VAGRRRSIMKRIIYLTAIGLFAALVPMQTATSKPEVADTSYFPLQIGYLWSYSGSYSFTQTITDTARANGHIYYGMAREGYPPSTWFRTSNDSVFVIGSLHDTSETLLYRLDAEVGDTITLPSEYACSYGNFIILAGKNDTVSTPSGIYFNCYRFEHVASCMDAGMMASWLAKGVGLVKFVQESFVGLETLSLDSFGVATPDTDPLAYYPLQVGNYWEYKMYSLNYPFQDSAAFSVRVTGDTTMANALTYMVLHRRFLYPDTTAYNLYERIDSLTGCLYMWTYNMLSQNHETKMDSLFAQAGDTIVSSWEGDGANPNERTICESILDDSALAIPTRIRKMRSLGSLDYLEYSLAKGIGLLRTNASYDFGSSWTNLVYATIDGKEYGKKIDTLTLQLAYYPLQTGDRWQYKTVSQCSDHTCFDTSAYSVEAIGDTLLPNGKHYEKLTFEFLYPDRFMLSSFERIDSSSGCVLRYDTTAPDSERQIDSLFAKPGDNFFTATHLPRYEHQSFEAGCRDIVNDTILSVPTQIKEFVEGSLAESGYTLARGFGICYIVTYWDDGTTRTTLVYTRISGKEYGTQIPDAVVDRTTLPLAFRLFQNYPNPFNPTTRISYQLAMNRHVTLKVYDVLGREVTTLVNEKQAAGGHSAYFDAGRLASGVYFYQLRAGGFVETKKMLVEK
jgi:hypothetical protein